MKFSQVNCTPGALLKFEFFKHLMNVLNDFHISETTPHEPLNWARGFKWGR